MGLRSVESLLLAQVLLVPLPVLFATRTFYAVGEHFALPWLALLAARTSLLDALLVVLAALVTLLLVHLLAARAHFALSPRIRLACLLAVLAAVSPSVAAELLAAVLFYVLAEDSETAFAASYTAWVLALAALVVLAPLSGAVVSRVGVPVALLRIVAIAPTLVFLAYELFARLTRS